jgi:hypothetical protein
MLVSNYSWCFLTDISGIQSIVVGYLVVAVMAEEQPWPGIDGLLPIGYLIYRIVGFNFQTLDLDTIGQIEGVMLNGVAAEETDYGFEFLVFH